MYIDTHCHYDDPKFGLDRAKVFKKLEEAGVEKVINCACDPKTLKSTIKLAQENKFVYAALGYHPHDVGKLDYDALDTLYDRVDGFEKAVAIGEIGLDYHYNFSPRDVQQEWFVEQLELAKELELPVIVHSREAAEDTYRILSEGDVSYCGGVIHAFSGSVEMAKRYLDLGLYIGIGGFSTFPDAKKLSNAIPEIPLDRILLETDCPYLTPMPHRGERNDSSYLPLVAARIAELKGITPEEVAAATTENAKRLFKF